MSRSRRPVNARQAQRQSGERVKDRKPEPARSRTSRAHLAFAVLSSLVICGLIAAALATVSPAGLFGTEGSDGQDESQNFEDPNQNVISEQETAVARNPDDREGLLLLANLYGNSNRLVEAIPIYERVLNMAPQDVSARLSFARALADGGMAADAELQFNKVLELEPDSQPAHYYLAELLRLSVPPRTAEAIEHYQRAAEIDDTTLVSERSREQLATLGVASPTGSPAAFSTPVKESTP